MFRFFRSNGLLRAAIVLWFTLLVFGFVPGSEFSKAATVERTIYTFQKGTPTAIPNFIDIDAGCNWSGIGGQVFDQNGTPMIGLIVKINGMFDGRQVLQQLTTGSSQRFGLGGFDLKLGDRPIASQTLRIQLLDAASAPLSPPFVLRTFDTCEQNLLVTNLTLVSADNFIYLPLVSR
jgi:hypothetical protein